MSKVVSIRVRNEVWEYFRGKGLNRVVEDIYDRIKGGEVEIADGRIIVRSSDDKREDNSV